MARKTKPASGMARIHFESVSALVSDAAQPLRLSGNANVSGRALSGSGIPNRRTWYGVDAPASKVCAMALEGHAEGVPVLEGFHATLNAKLPRAVGVARARKRGDFGDELDIHAVNRGACDKAWGRSVRALRTSSTVLRVYVDIGGNAGSDADALRWRGIAAVTLAELVRRAGYSVELVAVFATEGTSRDGQTGTIVSVTVKPRGASANLATLAGTVCLPGFFRTLGFHAITRALDNAGITCESGLGHYVSPESHVGIDPRVTCLFVPPRVHSENNAREWIEQTITLLQGATA